MIPGIRGPLTRLLSRLNLRFPALFLILLALTLLDLIVPDVLPFLDEIVLALLTTILGLWKERRGKTATAVDGVRRD